MNIFPQLTEDFRLARLTHPGAGKPIKMIMDTDTYNEIDDQFALAWALKSSNVLDIKAICAAPFFNERSQDPADGMEKSYQEILKIQELTGRKEIPAYRGSLTYLENLDQPVHSEAAQRIVELAMECSEDAPLYIATIGAITNVASAILMEPQIIKKIVVVWLGGHAFHWDNTREFNLFQDIHASRVIMNSNVPLVLVPCMGVASGLITTLSEIRDYVKDSGKLGNYLFETYRECSTDHFGHSRVIWDISVVAWLKNPSWCRSKLVKSPDISDDFHWIQNEDAHAIRYVDYVNRDAIFRDLFRTIAE